ncbi:glycosyltransferase 87 family protein [Streptomyces sp. SCSIO ZS0520]|uniref:glycosyltransferase 87 family protein n=1 Tax=Streptomyces sp. SCSIO ZS0520 TaxID=2892996 RepID=UPI0039868079
MHMRGAPPSGIRTHTAMALCWAGTRTLLLLWVFKVVVMPGPDVTSDVSVIYQGWYETLGDGHFPEGDVAWQYPPAAALAILSPALLPFLGYAEAFFVLALLTDAVVTALLVRAGRGPGRSPRGAWVWVAGVPLLGPTAYARYDLMVTALAVAALLAGARRPAPLGVFAALGALVKVWPALTLLGTERGRVTRTSWLTAAATGLGLLPAFALAMPGSLDFLGAQRERGTEVESLGALVFHVARHYGWSGRIELHYGSMEFLGPHVGLVSTLAQVLSLLALGWLVLWRLRARHWSATTLPDAAFVAVLLFTTTSRVISPQYMIWLVGLAAVCLLHRASRMGVPALLVLAATLVTMLEFPMWFVHVVSSDARGLTLMFLRNGLLVLASVLAARVLWRQTVTGPRDGGHRGLPRQTARGTEHTAPS